MTWSKQHLEQLKAAGKIRGYKLPALVPKQDVGGRKIVKHFKKRSKEKEYISWNLLYWCNVHIVTLEEEYKFNAERKFRFDYAIPALKVAIEYEGGIFLEISGHNTPKHYTKDADKYNLAAMEGWRVLRFTALNYKNLISELNKCL